MSRVGPLLAIEDCLSYPGGKLSEAVSEVRTALPPMLQDYIVALSQDEAGQFRGLACLFDQICHAASEILRSQGAVRIDLPIITRMISSPGSLAGSIPTDVNPFRVEFFGNTGYLTQSSQLYLELALLVPGIQSAFCVEKSFRQEYPDFRHLPEFNHIEYEGRGDLNSVIAHQLGFLRELVARVRAVCERELSLFTTSDRLDALMGSLDPAHCEILDFDSALALLYSKTLDSRYRRDSNRVAAFDAYAEVLLTQLLGDRTAIVTHYPADEVAFYHAETSDSRRALNADLLIAGYGEIIGSGERLHTARDVLSKAARNRIEIQDYLPYIQARELDAGMPHVGWGMGMERFLQVLTHRPFIWLCRLFPRLDGHFRI